MARRKDHSPEALKLLILQAGENIVNSKGMGGLTARALAEAVGYAPGTIYNLYRDMDALILDINYVNLGRLQAFCEARIKGLPTDFSRVRALAHGYVEFAQAHKKSWVAIFNSSRRDTKARLPKHYQERLAEIFALIEGNLGECLKIPAKEARKSARLLWACMHGITVLALDGRLDVVGGDDARTMVDDLLTRYWSVKP